MKMKAFDSLVSSIAHNVEKYGDGKYAITRPNVQAAVSKLQQEIANKIASYRK